MVEKGNSIGMDPAPKAEHELVESWKLLGIVWWDSTDHTTAGYGDEHMVLLNAGNGHYRP